MVLRLIVLGLGCMVLSSACKHKYPIPAKPPAVLDTTTFGGFPDDVGKIFHSNCVDGCHDAVAHLSDLRMDTWDNLFYGGAHGASVVPYSTAYSLLLHYINTNPANGPVATPGMPYQLPPLSDEEYKTTKDWIAKGAPDRNGRIAFADNADSRQKIYVTQQCDQMAVIDAERMVVMRYIAIGKTPGLAENPHCVRFTEDGRFAFVSFKDGTHLQKIDTRIDSVVEEFDLGKTGWEVILPSPDGSQMMLSNTASGDVAHLNLVTKKKTLFGQSNPHGIAALPGFDRFIIASQKGNVVTKMSVTETQLNKQYALDGKTPNTGADSYNPHEVVLSPDNDKLFITCQAADSLVVMDTSMNIIKSMALGDWPQEMAISKKHNYLFVSCMNDPSPKATAEVEYKGSVYVFNYKTLQKVAKIEWYFMDVHGLAVDDRNDKLYVFSRNFGFKGPAPHHLYGCGNKNGYFHVYDMSNLTAVEPIQGKREVLADPYSTDVRFK